MQLFLMMVEEVLKMMVEEEVEVVKTMMVPDCFLCTSLIVSAKLHVQIGHPEFGHLEEHC